MLAVCLLGTVRQCCKLVCTAVQYQTRRDRLERRMGIYEYCTALFARFKDLTGLISALRTDGTWKCWTPGPLGPAVRLGQPARQDQRVTALGFAVIDFNWLSLSSNSICCANPACQPDDHAWVEHQRPWRAQRCGRRSLHTADRGKSMMWFSECHLARGQNEISLEAWRERATIFEGTLAPCACLGQTQLGLERGVVFTTAGARERGAALDHEVTRSSRSPV